jgi:pilus assembly protein Flp/PilA
MIEYLSIMLNARRAKLDERGASAVEYGLLIAGIAAVIVVIVIALGDTISDAFSKTCTEIGTANGGSANADCNG